MVSSNLRLGPLYRLAWIFYLLLAVGAVLWIGARRGEIPVSLFIGPRRWWLDIAAGVAAAVLLVGFWRLLRRLTARARELEARLGDILTGAQPGELLGLALLSGFAEELFFRGAMQGAWGWLPATLLFALLHSGPGPAFRVWTLFAAVAGLVFAGLVVWRGNLLAPILAHVLVNAWNLRRLATGGLR
jgi:hypothetical protein